MRHAAETAAGIQGMETEMRGKKELKKSMIMHGLVLAHFVLMLCTFVAAWSLFYRSLAHQGLFSTNSMAVCTLYAVSLFMLDRIYTVYKVGLFRISELVYGQSLAALISLGLTYMLACVLALKPLNPIPLIALLLLQIILCALWTRTANKVYFKINVAKRTVVVYRDVRDLEKLEEIRYFESRWNVQKQIHCPETFGHDIPNGGRIAGMKSMDIYDLMEQLAGYEVVFVVGINAKLRNGIVKRCIETKRDCYFVPHTGDVIVSGAEHIKSFSIPILRARRANPSPEYLFVKRAFDIAASLIAILVASPFMLVTAIAIKAYDKGPALYKQVRLTKDGERFEILKFRSMKVNAEKDGVARLASEHDDRITPVGRIIRAIRFDELPQLFNILRGDMTIVGPRPERPEIAEQYMQELPAFSLRLQVKAGLTGYAQVYGRYNTEPSDKLKMDLMYINNMGVMEDLKLMFATVRILFMKESTSGIGEGQTTALGMNAVQKQEESA